jgi:hypothetical protein
VIWFTPAEDAVHGVVNDPNQAIVKRGGHTVVSLLYGEDQRFVVERLRGARP